jgi:hypothetical protein
MNEHDEDTRKRLTMGLLNVFAVFTDRGQHEYARRIMLAIKCLHRKDDEGAKRWVALADVSA